MKKLLMIVVAFSLSANVAFAFNMDKAVEDACSCYEEYHKHSKKMMDAMNKAQASGDMSKMRAMKSEVTAVTDALTKCFDDLAEKYPEIDKSEKLQEEVMAKVDEKCPNPAKVK